MKKVGKQLTTADFVERARAKHGDRYDYGRVHYVNITTEVEVVCQTHGPFWIKPNQHLWTWTGCPVCANEVKQAKTQQRVEQGKLLPEASISPREIATVLETISQWMVSEGMEELAGYNASWFRDAAEEVEVLRGGSK